WTLHRRQSAGILPESCLPAGWAVVANSQDCSGDWLGAFASIKMSSEQPKPKSPSINDAIRETLSQGSSATLLTVLESAELTLGAKLLIAGDGGRVGDLGDSGLNEAAARSAGEFLGTREEANVRRVAEFAPDVQRFRDSLILFERIETEPQLVIAGAGHVGAALARLAALVGYRVTL